jgi:hypothetical protein
VSQTRRIGSDHVIVGEGRLIVISRARMDVWRTRTYRQTQIRFEGRNWRIAEVALAPPDATRYTLVPWDDNDHDVIGLTIEYGPDYVANRDRTAARDNRSRRVTGALRLVAPFTGFLSARIKDRLEVSYGIDSVATTKQSVIMETIAIMGGFVVAQIGMITGVVPYPPFIAFSLLLLPDAAVRWDRVLDEYRPPPGFYEWVFRRARRGP